MLRKPHHLFLPMLPSDLYTVILPNLSFKNLTLFAENENPGFDDDVRSGAEDILRKKHPAYINLKAYKLNRHFTPLIDNLVRRVLPLINGPIHTKIKLKTESTYQKLCAELGPFMGYLIGSHLFSSHAQNEIDPVIIHDLVFHFCQYSPQAAGELLNKNILRLWNTGNRYLANYLIEYGANVNALAQGGTHSTLFHAVTFNSSEEIIRLLIDHGANYSGYNQTRHGVQYTLMLITALNRNLEALPVLIEKFPNEVNTTLETLEVMAKRNRDDEFTCEFGAYLPCDNSGAVVQKFYTIQDLKLAQELILQVISQNTKTQENPASPRSRLGLFSASPTRSTETPASSRLTPSPM
jgi:hypothetical protein